MQATQNMEIKHTREYIKVPQKKQAQLIKLVLKKLWKIKSAASYLGIKYACGKSIIKKNRRNKLQTLSQPKMKSKRCHYKKINTMDSFINVISSSYGKYLREVKY